MPKQINTTKTFEDVLVAIRNKGMKVTAPKVGDVYELAGQNGPFWLQAEKNTRISTTHP